jgi:hypothetical protein
VRCGLWLEPLETRILLSGSPLSAAVSLTFGPLQTAHVAGRLADSESFDLYRLGLGPGDIVRAAVSARTSGSGLESALRVFDSSGSPVATNDQEGGDPQLTFQAPTAGDYFVGVSSAGDDAYDPNVAGSGSGGSTTGMYTLDVRLTPGQPLAAELAGRSFRLQTSAAAYGDSVSGTFTVENRGGIGATALDVQLVLSPNNLFGAGSSVLATFAVPALPAGQAFSPGDFTVTLPDLSTALAAGLPQSGPVYLGLWIGQQAGIHRGADWETLTIVTPVTASGSNHLRSSADVLMDPNSRVRAVLSTGLADWYQLTLSDQERLAARTTALSSTLLPRLALYGEGGQLLIQSDEGAITQPLQPGTYFLRVSARSGAGSYQLISEAVPISPPGEQLPVGSLDSSVLVADLTGDGYLDLVTANSGSDTVSVLLSNGDGTFQPQRTFAAGHGPVALAVADINGDGKPDLIVTDEGTQSDLGDTVSVLLGNGDGTFQAPQTFTVGGVPAWVAVADLNGDGRPDIVTANYADGTVSVLLNETAPGASTLSLVAQPTCQVGADPDSLAVADLNGDGIPDLVVANQGTNAYPGDTISVLQGNGDGTFQPQQTYLVGKEPDSVAVADINGDGKPDLVVANYGGGTVSVLLGAGKGVFQPQQTFAAGAGPEDVAVADLNGDGKPDLITANYGRASATVSVLLNETDSGGAVSFAAPQTVSVGADPRQVAAADFNSDGIPDLVTANSGGGTVSLLTGNGDGTFQTQPTFAIGSLALAVATGDLNGDGKPDLVTANFTDNTVSVLLGNGDGTFQTQQTFAVGPGPDAVAVADLNGDGKRDIITANYDRGTVSVLLNNGDGTFQPAESFAVGQGPTGVAVADVNGDGIPDIITTNYASGTVSVLLGNGDGTFQPQQTFTVGTGPQAVAVADLNDDGRPDLVVANYGEGTVSGLLNQTARGAHVVTFAPEQPFNVGPNPQAVAVGLANDGSTEVVTANSGADTLSVLRNETPRGAASASFAAAQTLPVGMGPDAVAVADLNGDGIPDLVAANFGSMFNPATTISVLLGNADGTFQPQQTYVVGGLPTLPAALAVADFNGNGPPDIAVASDLVNTVSVLMGRGNGTFLSPAQAVGVGLRNTPYQVDLNGDGIPDTVILDDAGNILYRQGQPGTNHQFAPPIVLNPGRPARAIAVVKIGTGWAIAAADTNPDAQLSSPGHLIYDISLYTMGPPLQTVNVPPIPPVGVIRTTAFTTDLGPTSLAAADLTGNGSDDLVAASALGDSVTVALQTAPGIFAAAAPLPVGVAPSDIALIDVNGDGLRDIVVADQASGDVSVLLNDTTHSFLTAERFRVGAGSYGLNTASGAAVLNSLLQPVSLAAGDFTGNGRNDLVVVERGAHALSVLANDGDGGFADPRATLTTSTSDGFTINAQPGPVVAGKFNGVGPLDLAVLMEDQEQVWIYTGSGNGTFTHTASIPAGDKPTGLALVPGSAPGLFDLLVGTAFGDVLRLVGDGTGSFRPAPLVSGDHVPLDVLPLGNGQTELVVANQQADRVTVQALQPGSGQVLSVRTLTAENPAAQLAPGAVQWAKLDRNSPYYDAVVVGSGSNDVLIYRGTGVADGQLTFAAPASYAVGTDPVSVTIADVNGDGIPDLLVADQGSNAVTVLFGSYDPAGDWVARPGPRLKSGGEGPVAVTVRDLNGNGIPDLIVTNSASGTLAVLPGVGQGFFNDRNPQILTVPGNPVIGAPSFAGSSADGVLATGDGRLIAFNLEDFAATVRTVFLPGPGEEITAEATLPNGELVAAEQDGAVVLLEQGPGSSFFQTALNLTGLTGTPSDPSALAVLETQAGLQVYVTSAGQDGVYLFVPLPGAQLPGSSSGPTLPPLTPGPPTLVTVALGDAPLAVGVILTGGLLFAPEGLPAPDSQGLPAIAPPNDEADDQLPVRAPVPPLDRAIDSRIEELLRQGEPNVLPNGEVPHLPSPPVKPQDGDAFWKAVGEGQVSLIDGFGPTGNDLGMASPSDAEAPEMVPCQQEDSAAPAVETGAPPRHDGPVDEVHQPASARGWDRMWMLLLAVLGLRFQAERDRSQQLFGNAPSSRYSGKRDR